MTYAATDQHSRGPEPHFREVSSHLPAVPVLPAYSASVPAVHDSLTVLEDLCEIYLLEDSGLTPGRARLVRDAVREALLGAVERAGRSAGTGVMRLAFYRRGAGNQFGPSAFRIELSDPGNGLEMFGISTPWPEEVVGSRLDLLSCEGWIVEALLTGSGSIRLFAREDDGTFTAAHEDFAPPQERARGLVALCLSWSDVRMTWQDGIGTTLLLDQAVEPPENF